MRGQHQSQAGVIRESLSDESDVETRYEFAAYTICGAVSTRRGEIEGLPHNTLSKPLQRTRLDGLRRVRQGFILDVQRPYRLQRLRRRIWRQPWASSQMGTMAVVCLYSLETQGGHT